MDTVGPLLLGALLTLLAQAVLQLRIIPRVEARKRREDRWEKDVRALGELLTGEVPEAARVAYVAARAVWSTHYALHHPRVLPNKVDELNLLLHEQRDAVTETRQAVIDLAHVRVGWLVRRTVAIDPDAPVFAALSLQAQAHRFSVIGLFDHPEPAENRKLLSKDYDRQHERDLLSSWDTWEREERERNKLLELVEGMADRPPPRRAAVRLRPRRRRARRAVPQAQPAPPEDGCSC